VGILDKPHVEKGAKGADEKAQKHSENP